MANISKINVNGSDYDIKDATAARKGMYIGTCSTAADTAAKVATTDSFPLDANNKPLIGTTIGIKYSNTNTYKTAGTTMTLDVNNTGAYPIYYNNAEVVSTTSANTLACGYKNRYIYYVFNGTLWVWTSCSYDTNTTYSATTTAELNTGTSTTSRTVTAQVLRDNFFLKEEIKFVVEVTVNALFQVSNPSATFAEIKAAYDSGAIVVASDGYEYLCVCCTALLICFFNYDDQNLLFLTVTSSNVWSCHCVSVYNIWDSIDSKTNVVLMKRSGNSWYKVAYLNGAHTISNTALTGDIKNVYIDFDNNDLYHWDPLESSFIKVGATQKVTVSNTASTTYTLYINNFYVFSTAVSSLTLLLVNPPDGLGIYAGKFTAASDNTTISVPSGVSIAASIPDIVANHVYEFNIMDNILLLADVTT